MVDKKWLQYGRSITKRLPILLPLLRPLKRKLFSPNTPIILFSGWGMTTEHQLPWIDDKQFQQINQEMKTNFEFTEACDVDSTNVDILLWRHWIVSHAIRHAITFADAKNYNFVECGVAAGESAFFALKEIQNHDIEFVMHLYDSWSTMKKEYLFDNESQFVGRYSALDINKTKKIF